MGALHLIYASQHRHNLLAFNVVHRAGFQEMNEDGQEKATTAKGIPKIVQKQKVPTMSYLRWTQVEKVSNPARGRQIANLACLFG